VEEALVELHRLAVARVATGDHGPEVPALAAGELPFQVLTHPGAQGRVGDLVEAVEQQQQPTVLPQALAEIDGELAAGGLGELAPDHLGQRRLEIRCAEPPQAQQDRHRAGREAQRLGTRAQAVMVELGQRRGLARPRIAEDRHVRTAGC